MLGLIGTVGGAVALEIRRIRKKGGPEELKEVKQREKELQQLLEATNRELARAQKQNETAEQKAQLLEQQKAELEQQAAELGKQKEQLQQNTAKLVLTNCMLLNKAKHLEDNSRALVAKQEALQHQLEQLQRERQAEQEASDAALAALKDQVTGVLNRYLSKDIDLQAALQEMQAMGIELVPLVPEEGRPDHVVEFEPKFVLDSPHRMQRLMNAAAGKILHLPASAAQDVPMLSFPMGIGKDPTTGMPRVSLGWRHEPQGTAGSLIDAGQKVSDQQALESSTAALSLADKPGKDTTAASSSSSTLLTLGEAAAEKDTLTVPSSAKKQSGFSLGFGSIGRITMRSSEAGQGKASKAAGSKPLPSSFLKTDALSVGDDDMPAFTSTALTTR